MISKLCYTHDALEILNLDLEENPALKKAYLEEKKNYHIACKIREYRKFAKLTQKKLAQLIGTHPSVISRLENAEYQRDLLPILTKISEALEVPVDKFLM